VFEITGSDDPGLVGMLVKVVKSSRQSNATARRFQVEETQ